MSKLTPDEEVFFRRVALTMRDRSLNALDAMRAVLQRDEELLIWRETKPEQWRALVSEIAADVYRDIRQKAGA